MATEVSFGRWLQRRRKSLDLTQRELAAQAAISIHTLRKIENDERRPSREVAATLAAALNLAPSERETFIRAARQQAGDERLGEPQTLVTALADALPLAGPALPGLRCSLPALTTAALIGRERELAESATPIGP